MLLLALERHEPIESVVWFDSGWEFHQMHEHLAMVEQVTGLPIQHLTYHVSFDELLIRYSWPTMLSRWCTAAKRDTIIKYVRRNHPNAMECIGYAADEKKRALKHKRPAQFPLIEWGITEKKALDVCKSYGFDWGGLYDVFKRVSCFCCPLGGLRDARRLRSHYHQYWKRVLEMDDSILVQKNRGYLRGKTAREIEDRFLMEDRQLTLRSCIHA